jgi:acyl-CoA dehydrogenase
LAALGAVVQAVAYHSGSVPIVEKTLLADWLLALVGLPVDARPVVAVDGARAVEISDGHVSGSLLRVPWGCTAARVAVLVCVDGTPAVAVLDPGVGDRGPGTSIANEARDSIALTSADVQVIRIAGMSLDEIRAELHARGALGRTMQIAGAARAACDLTYQYVHAREQFGRPLARFQAVKQTLARMVERATLISTAADSAAAALSTSGADAWRAIAAAKWVASRYADPVARDAHQLHGAIGVTVEYPLHLVTSRLWAWSAEYGTARYWSMALGRSVRASHGAGPWAAVTAISGD